MRFTRREEGTRTVLTIEGSLDAVSTPELRPVIDALVKEGKREVTLELGGLRLIDSSGVGVIVSLYKRIHQQGGEVKIVGMRDQPLAIFKLLRLDRVFDL